MLLFAVTTVMVSKAESAVGGVMVVDSQKIFMSLESYQEALSDVERMEKSYKSQVETAFKIVEIYYSEYAEVRATLNASQRSAREKAILEKESEATALQERYFAKDGALMKRRLELISPIQKQVFAAINEYAESKGFDVVLDKAANATLLYNSSRSDKTLQIIEKLNGN